jgi:hypothetical protein
MVRGRHWRAGCLLVLAGLLGAGCSSTYMRNRGHDAMQCIDWGYVTTKKPNFAVFNDYFNAVPIGYSDFEGTFHGIGNGHCGSMPIRIQYWGLLAWGGVALQLGEFDINNPFQVSPEEMAALRAANQPLPTTTPWYHTGFLRMALYDQVPPRRTGFM